MPLNKFKGVVFNETNAGNPLRAGKTTDISTTPVLQSTSPVVHAAATANVNLLSPGTTMDGVTMVNGYYYLLPSQTDQTTSFIYQFNGSALVIVDLYQTLAVN